MTVRGRAVHKNHNPTLYIYLSLTIYFFIMDACPGQIQESTNWIEMKLGYTYIMAVRSRAVHKNHNLSLYIYKVISP